MEQLLPSKKQVAIASGIIVLAAAPVVLGYGATGIIAGSAASKMMSAAAIANGGGVAAGSAVAMLQSFGATSLGTKLAVAGTTYLVAQAASEVLRPHQQAIDQKINETVSVANKVIRDVASAGSKKATKFIMSKL